MNKPIIYTVGHSTHQLDYFLELLEEYSVNCLVDVRSVAASGRNPQFNKEVLSNFLKNNRINYLHFAEEFGARHTDPELLDSEGRVDFEKVRRSWNFRNGVERLWQGVNKGFKIVLMCSESEPLECHRFSMVSFALERDGFAVKHILKDKSLKENTDLESQLIKKYYSRIPKPDIFKPSITKEEQLIVAYRLSNKEIGYSPRMHQPQEQHD